MSDAEIVFDAPVYAVPRIVQSMGIFLRGPRAEYSTNFTDVFSSDREVQYQYVNGLLAVMVSFVTILIFWIFVLCVLKCRGDDVGCASGQPFQRQRGDDDDLSSTDDDMDDVLSSIGSASQSDSKDNSVSKLIKNKNSFQNLSADEKAGDGPPTDNLTRDESYDTPSRTVRKQSQINQRERRTRFCFVLFGILSLICVPLILAISFGPLKEATQTSDELVMVARDTVLQVNASIESIEDAIAGATQAVQGATLDIHDICPNIDADELETRIGIDLNETINRLITDFDSMTELSQENIQFLRGLLQSLEEGFTTYETSVTETEEWLWVIPAVLFSVSMVTIFAMIGVLLAWREKSGKNVQNTMAYVVLPLLMATTVACWTIIIFASLGTMVGSDACTASNSKGSPDETIQQILSALNLDTNSTTFKVVEAYTNRCTGPSPTVALEELEQTVQDSIDMIWREVSRVDSLGRAQIMEACGTTKLEGLLLMARNLATFLTTIRRSLSNTSSSLSCPRINLIYAGFAHDAVCTEAASAVASGFFLFLVLGFSLMAMISLRASWYMNIKAEKVYHDESEGAENMIVDEHEEYLAYISKYKHEWQEYRGFDEKAIDEENNIDDGGSFSDRSDDCSSYFDEDYRIDAEGYNGSMEEGSDDGSEGSGGGYQVVVVPVKFSKSEPNVRNVDSADDVSLPNFGAQESMASNTSMVAEDLLRVPPPSPVNQVNLRVNPPPPPPPPPPSNPKHRRQEPKFHREQTTNATAPETSMLARKKSANESLSFFDKYGIDPGASVRTKRSISSPMYRPPSTDPPVGNLTALSSPRETLPSGRKVFRTNMTNENEVEIQLNDSFACSTQDNSDDCYEC